MQLGIIGLPQSGKTTLFNALTNANIPPTDNLGGHMQVHTAVVDVPDPRVDELCAIYKPKKTVHAKVTYADIAGIDGKAGKAGLPGPLINQMASMDGFCTSCVSSKALWSPTRKAALTPPYAILKAWTPSLFSTTW